MPKAPRRRICIVTGSRAEYGIYRPVLQAIEASRHFALQLVVTGTHLSAEFGLTYREIEQDGYRINAKLKILTSGDGPVEVTQATGRATSGFGEIFSGLKPDLVLVLGDRYEMLAAAQAALLAQIPMAHIGGGDVTEGAVDESIRHSITKMSHLHFVTHAASARRVHQLGENPKHIHVVGTPALDSIRLLPVLDRATLEADLRFKFRSRNLLVTFHPETLGSLSAEAQGDALFAALSELGTDIGLIFTFANADAGGRAINARLRRFVRQHPNACAYPSLGQARYFSLIRQVDAVVGNSSSGIYEVPSFKKPTVNIGDRQRGRIFAHSVISVPWKSKQIQAAIASAFRRDCSKVKNPFGDGDAARRIVRILERTPDFQSLLRKPFFDLGR